MYSIFDLKDDLQGRRHEVLNRWGGGTDVLASEPPTPNSDFSSDFGHLVLKISETPKNSVCDEKFSFKFIISVGYPLQIFGLRGTCPPPPPSHSILRWRQQ